MANNISQQNVNTVKSHGSLWGNVKPNVATWVMADQTGKTTKNQFNLSSNPSHNPYGTNNNPYGTNNNPYGTLKKGGEINEKYQHFVYSSSLINTLSVIYFFLFFLVTGILFLMAAI